MRAVTDRPRILVVEHEADDPPAWFGVWLEDAGCDLHVCQPWAGDALPEDGREGRSGEEWLADLGYQTRQPGYGSETGDTLGEILDSPERDAWLACMLQAMEDTGVEEKLRASLLKAFFGTADWMRNRGA